MKRRTSLATLFLALAVTSITALSCRRSESRPTQESVVASASSDGTGSASPIGAGSASPYPARSAVPPPTDAELEAIEHLCDRLAALPVRKGHEPYLTLLEQVKCRSNMRFLQRDIPLGFRMMTTCAAWARDSSDMAACSREGKLDADAGTFTVPTAHL